MQLIDDRKTISLLILAVFILGAGWAVFSRGEEIEDVFQASIAQIEETVLSDATVARQAELKIDNNVVEQSFNFKLSSATTTAFDLLKQVQKISGLQVETIDYGDMGLLVESIGGKKNGQDGKNWIYYVNNELAKMSVDKEIIQAGDKVEFKFETSPF